MQKEQKFFVWLFVIIGLVGLARIASREAASYTAIALIVLALYLIPSIIAITRNKRNQIAILVLNILLGWTFIGWVVAIVWALTVDADTTISQSEH